MTCLQYVFATTAARLAYVFTANDLACTVQDLQDGGLYEVIAAGHGTQCFASTGSGNVAGPGSATDTAIALFDGTTGKLLKNSAITVTSAGRMMFTQPGSGLLMDVTFTDAAAPHAQFNVGSSVFNSTTDSYLSFGFNNDRSKAMGSAYLAIEGQYDEGGGVVVQEIRLDFITTGGTSTRALSFWHNQGTQEVEGNATCSRFFFSNLSAAPVAVIYTDSQAGMQLTPATWTGSSGGAAGLRVIATVNASGTHGYGLISAELTETAYGSGNRYLFGGSTGGSVKFSVDASGNTVVAGTLNAGAYTGTTINLSGTLAGAAYTGTTITLSGATNPLHFTATGPVILGDAGLVLYGSNSGIILKDKVTIGHQNVMTNSDVSLSIWKDSSQSTVHLFEISAGSAGDLFSVDCNGNVVIGASGNYLTIRNAALSFSNGGAADINNSSGNLRLYSTSSIIARTKFQVGGTADMANGDVRLTLKADASQTGNMINVSSTGGTADLAYININGAFFCKAGFGCNNATPQTAYASGGALAAYGAGVNGFDTAGNASSLYAMVVSIRAALVANGIMS